MFFLALTPTAKDLYDATYTNHHLPLVKGAHERRWDNSGPPLQFNPAARQAQGGRTSRTHCPTENSPRQPGEVVRNLSVSPWTVETFTGRQRKLPYRFHSPGQDARAVVDRRILNTGTSTHTNTNQKNAP